MYHAEIIRASGNRVLTRYSSLTIGQHVKNRKICKYISQVDCCKRPSHLLFKTNSRTSAHYITVCKSVYNTQRTVCLKKSFSTCSQLLQSPIAQLPGRLRDESVDPFTVAEKDLLHLHSDIKKELWTSHPELCEISGYYFDSKGKVIRPVMVILMSRAINYHLFASSRLSESQYKIAMIAEMIHNASLVHDDVVDASDLRRGKPSINLLCGQKKAVLSGDYICAHIVRIFGQFENEVMHLLSQTLVDLVKGELMQVQDTKDDREHFSHYLQKTFNKTASLSAYTCKAAAVVGGADALLQEAAFQYGKNVGIAFQLIDDMLDFISSESEMGKPVAADLKLSLATAPVLFACEMFPELQTMVKRRFSSCGDVERTYDAVLKSDGLTKTRLLAHQHCDKALSHISILRDSVEKKALVATVKKILERTK